MKKFISIILSFSILLSSIPAFAENLVLLAEDLLLEEEESVTSLQVTPIEESVVLAEEETQETEYAPYEPIVHTETFKGEIDFGEEEMQADVEATLENEEISTMSLTSEESDAWKFLYSQQFGDEYLSPFSKKDDGQYVTGNTNRLVIEETDLSLKGKNGLDLVIKRKYDNQDYDKVFSTYHQNGATAPAQWYLYGFINKSTNEHIYIAFPTEDIFYTYMYEDCFISPYFNGEASSVYINGATYSYYYFQQVQINTDGTGIEVEYDGNGWKSFSDMCSSIYMLTNRRMFARHNYLNNMWRFVLPEAYLYRYDYYHTTSRKYNSYVGAFRDINGDVHTLYGSDDITVVSAGEYTYSSSFTPDINKFLSFESYYQPQYLYENGPLYNFVVYDSSGYTYYMYNQGVTVGEFPSNRHAVYVVAVKDDYGNMIRYEYDFSDANGRISKIIDTYGREINFEEIDNGIQIRYTDDLNIEKTIKYEHQELPASTLNNDSNIKPKPVQRHTVTDENGEKTIYDARRTENMVMSFTKYDDINIIPGAREIDMDKAISYNIEEITYPTGAKTRYKYKILSIGNMDIRVCRGVYAVEKSYDVIGEKEENKKEYSFTNEQLNITSTCIEESADRKTVRGFNSKGLETSNVVSNKNNTLAKKSTYYWYDDNNCPTSISTRTDSGETHYTYYSYNSLYPMLLVSEHDGKRKLSYSYHTDENNRITPFKSKVIYSKYKSDSGVYTKYTDDYYIETTLTSDKRDIEFERIIKDGEIKSQTKYIYDTAGELLSTRMWAGDTNGTGTLEGGDELIALSNTHSITSANTRKLKQYISTVYNADGENVGPVIEEYVYNIYGTPVSQKAPNGAQTLIEYDAVNRPVKYTLPNGAIRTIEYNTVGNYTLVTDEAGITLKYEYDGLGKIKANYRLGGNTYQKLTEYAYDSAGRVSAKTTYRSSSTGTKEEYTYDELDRVRTKKVYNYSGTLLYSESYSYETSYFSGKVHNVTTKTVTADGVTTATEKTHYDVYGNVAKTEKISGDITYTHTYEYDDYNRLIKETDANGNATSYEYNVTGQVTKQTDAQNNTIETAYDFLGRAVSVTDALGNTTNTVYDRLGRVVKVTTPFDDEESGETKTYYDKNSNVIKTSVLQYDGHYRFEEFKYDIMGNLIASIQENGDEDMVTQYTYDSANRVTSMITGLTEYSETPTGGAVTTYTYDSLGRLYKVTDPMGYSETYSAYDYQDNVTNEYDKNGVAMYHSYNSFGKNDTYFTRTYEEKLYTYNKIGQLISSISYDENEETITESYTYDAFGRVSSVISNDGSVQNYTYDGMSNVLSYNLTKDGETKNSITYQYDSLNRLTSMTNNGIITTYTYDANGNLTQRVQDNGLTASYTYNNAGLMTSVVNKKNDTSYARATYSYYLDGLMEMSVTTSGRRRMYYYDDLGRVTNELIYKDSDMLETSYEYDLRGNISSKTSSRTDRETTDYTYDLNNRLISEECEIYHFSTDQTYSYTSADYEYDNNGNMTKKISEDANGTQTQTYAYDNFNRLTSYGNGTTTASYKYSTNNLRAEKAVNGVTTKYVWNGQNLAGETTGEQTNAYTYDMTGVYIANKNGTVSSYIKGFHNNVVATADATGTMLQTQENHMDYDAFGNQWNGTSPDPFGYCGEYYDSESGLIYLRNRYYDSTTGRFITEDPIKDGLNWYSYCAGNPISFVDPSGFKAKKTWGEFIDGLNQYTFQDSIKANSLSEVAEDNAIRFAMEKGYYKVNEKGKHELVTWDNTADAMRHSQWNSMMTREMSYQKAKFYANNHEIAELERLGWLEYADGNTVVSKMNQPTLMDLWNNSTGRALALDQELSDMNYNKLFGHAIQYDMLITDVNQVYQFYGVLDYVNTSDWTVNVEWNLNSGNITFKKENLPDLTLKVGRWGV